MDAVEALLTRRSTKADEQVGPGPSDEDLKTLLTIATRVPDHGKLTPWRIQVLRAEGQRALGIFLADLYRREHPEAEERHLAAEAARPARAPLLLVVTTRLRPSAKIPEREQLLSGGAVCTSILIGAHALGYAAQWLTEWPAYHDAVVRHLGHDPATDRILGFLYLGNRSRAPIDRPRPDLAEIVGEWTGPEPLGR